MTGAGTADIVEVKMVDEQTDCRRCHTPIHVGRRAALVLGTGTVHLRCLLGLQAVDTGQERTG
jgi:hypothetical protein